MALEDFPNLQNIVTISSTVSLSAPPSRIHIGTMLGPSHRSAVVTAIGVCVLLTIWLNIGRSQSTSLGAKLSSVTLHPSTWTATTGEHLPAPVALYFDQVFREEKGSYDFPGLREHCERTEWTEERENVYIHCGNLFAGEF